MNFLDADVMRPLAPAVALVDEENRLGFGPLESYMKHVRKGQTSHMCGRNGVFFLQLEMNRSD